MPQPLVTIGITCFNDSRFITTCLNSVFAQTYSNLEVIVVDDHSTDDTVSRLRAFGDRIRLIEHSSNSGGYMRGRKEVIAAARGDLVGHLDGDDFLQPDFIERHVDAFRNDPSLDWVAGNLILVDADGRETTRWDYQDFPTDPFIGLRRGFLTASVPVPKNGLFSLRFLREHKLDWYQLPRTANGSDAYTCIRYLERNPKIRLLPFFGLNYRIHGGNRCGNVPERIKMTIDLKEYYISHHNELVYLPHPDFLKYPAGSQDYLAFKYYLLAVEFYRTMRDFHLPDVFASRETGGEVERHLDLFHEPIRRYAEQSLGCGERHRKELTTILHAIGHRPETPVCEKKPRDHRTRSPITQTLRPDKAMQFASQSLETINTLATTAYERGAVEEAQEYTAAAVKLAPHDPTTLNIAGVIAFSTGLQAEAEVLFKRALAADSGFTEARLNLCDLWGSVLHQFSPDTQRRRDLLQTIHWLADHAPDPSRSALMQENHSLRAELLARYKNRWQPSGLRVLLHRPSNGALKYLMDSWAQVLAFAGVETRLLNWGEMTAPALDQFEPNLFITVADPNYMSQLDRNCIEQHRRSRGMRIGHITTFEHEFPPCDFLLTFHFDPRRDPRMRHTEVPLLSLPFAINPLIHYMRPGVEVWDYFFVGTNSPRKVEPTKSYLLPLVQRYSGVLAGGKWDVGLGELSINEAAMLYNFARIYPNYSTPRHFEEFNEVNERTFIIPACGGFELMDNPVAVRELFTDSELAVAESPARYLEMFDHYLHRPEERLPIVRAGMQRVYREYTLFHVLEKLVRLIGTGMDGEAVDASAYGAIGSSRRPELVS